MNNLIRVILDVLQALMGGGGTDKTEAPHPVDDVPLPDDIPSLAALGAGAGNEILDDNPPSHALVLPDRDFLTWYEAVRDYTAHFKNVIVVRSPAGNNLNRFKVVTAVNAPRVWYNSDPVAHIRRAYLNVVTVDVIEASTPTELQQALAERIRTDSRYGNASNRHTRFTLDWPTDSASLLFRAPFDADLGNGRRNEGLTIAATRGTTVRAAADGTVFNITVDNSALGYGTYIQVQTTADDGTPYLVTYTNLNNIRVQNGQTVSRYDPLGVAANDDGVKLVLQRPNHDSGNRYLLSGVVNPTPFIYVNKITLRTTATKGLNIRKGQSTDYDRVGSMNPDEVAYPLEVHGYMIEKFGQPDTANKWINLDTASSVTGFGAAWLLEAQSPRSATASVVVNSRFGNGINLDRLHHLGSPDPSRLGNMTYVRMAYNVSMGQGSKDLNKAYEVYAPYFSSLAKAGKKVILVYTHQTYGEGAGYVWPQMTADRWNELGSYFADYVRAIAKTYANWDVIVAHQIWNEQDAYEGAQASVTMSATDYAGILGKAVQSIRSVDSKTPIITGGHTAGPGIGAAYARSTLNALPSNIWPDGIAVHPYGRGTGVAPKYEQFGHIKESITTYSNIMPGKPIWITEWGVLNANQEPAADIEVYASAMLNYVRRYYGDKVAALVWYAWADSMHNGYGLVGQNDQPKEPLYTNYISVP